MRPFAEAYSNPAFVQQVAAQIPWFHNCVLLDKMRDAAVREWNRRLVRFSLSSWRRLDFR